MFSKEQKELFIKLLSQHYYPLSGRSDMWAEREETREMADALANNTNKDFVSDIHLLADFYISLFPDASLNDEYFKRAVEYVKYMDHRKW